MRKSFVLLSGIVTAAVFTFSCSSKENQAGSSNRVIDSLQKQIAIKDSLLQKEENNKKMVAEFYQQLFGDKNIEVIDKYISENYIQHNPMLPDGREPLKNAAAMWFKDAPKETIDIWNIGADGDFVYLHTRAVFGGKLHSVIDIFRIENGIIVEHWDVIQAVPEKSANPHPMF